MAETIRVLVGDSYPFFCQGIQAALADSCHITFLDSARSGTELLKICQYSQPELLLLDFNLVAPDSGISIQAFKEACPALKVLLLLADHDNVSLLHIKQQGAAGVILKSDPLEKWLEAITAVSQNEWWLSPRLMQTLIDPPLPKPGHDLNERELAVLRLIVAGKKDKEIAHRLNLSERMVRYDLEHICASLGVESRLCAAVAATRLKLFDP